VISDWFIWFWAMTAIAAAELLFIATWDLLADLTGWLPHLVMDQAISWPPWAHAVLIPAFLVAGIVVDHFWVH
jgi:hypothetical protein